jgi:hypothetical protein
LVGVFFGYFTSTSFTFFNFHISYFIINIRKLFLIGFKYKNFLIRYIPRLSITSIVRKLKQESTRKIWLLHPTILRKQYWYQQILWSDGYFVCSIGEASPETIRQYI